MIWFRCKFLNLWDIYNNYPSVIAIVTKTYYLVLISPCIYILILYLVGNFQLIVIWPLKSFINSNFFVFKAGLIICPVAIITIGLSKARKHYLKLIS